MKEILTVENMRASDAAAIEAGTPGRVLMARAGKAVSEAVSWKAPAAVLCGSGNNGGDGYVIALALREKDIPVTLIRLKDRCSEDGAYYLDACRKAGIPEMLYEPGLSLSSYSTLVDCLFGTGFHGPAKDVAAELIREINRCRKTAQVISVDINSGLSGESGQGDPAVRSDLTVSVGGYKPGHFLGRAKDLIGELKNVDIGIRPVGRTQKLMEAEDAAKALPRRFHASHKGSYGYTALIGGSERYSGAPRLAEMANSAMRCGAGVVLLAVPRSISAWTAPQILESTLFPLSERDGSLLFREEEFAELCGRVSTIAFGMGIGMSDETVKAVRWLLEHFDGTLILDADGLNALAVIGPEAVRSGKPRVILTPHVGEMARLSGLSAAQILDDPVKAAEEAAGSAGCILLLKGASTVVTDGTETWLCDRGCPGMATAGSGDVLSGAAAALCGFNRDDLLTAVAAAAYICGAAGEKAQKKTGAAAMVASDTARHIAETVFELEQISEGL